jgi:mono/diheme cytochrome c family protein
MASRADRVIAMLARERGLAAGRGVIKVERLEFVGLGQLDDAQVAAVLTYIRNGWGAAAPAVSADDVRKQRTDLANRSD